MSAIQQVEEAFGVPVVSVVALSHLTEFMAARGDTAGVDVEVQLAQYYSRRRGFDGWCFADFFVRHVCLGEKRNYVQYVYGVS